MVKETSFSEGGMQGKLYICEGGGSRIVSSAW